MAADIFLKLTGIDGESQDSKHKGEIEILSWSWGVSQTSTAAAGGGASAGKVAFQDFSIVKFVDKATPQLMQACCTGKHVPEASFTARRAGESQMEYLKIKLTDVLISSVQPGGSNGDQLAMEQVSFSFSDSMITVYQQDATGGAGGEETAILCGASIGRR